MNQAGEYVCRQRKGYSSRSNPCLVITVSPRATAVIFLAIALLLAVPTPVEAQTAAKLVGNLDQGEDDSRLTDHQTFQKFTTGDNADSYELTSVEIKTDPGGFTFIFSAAVYTIDSNGYPDAVHASLTAPPSDTDSSFAPGIQVFTAEAGAALAANETYAVVITPREITIPDAETLQAIYPHIDPTKHNLEGLYKQAHRSIQLDVTGSRDENPAMSGWSIANGYEFWYPYDSAWHTSYGTSLRIAINGYAVGAGSDHSPPPPQNPPPPTQDPPPTGAISEAPQYLRTIPGDSEVTLTWDAPFYNGGAEITGYAYRLKESGETFGVGDTGTWQDIPGGGSARRYTVTGLTNGTEYTFEVRAKNVHGGGIAARAIARLPASAGSRPVSTENEEIPDEIALMGNYPNPFNPETAIIYALPQAGEVRLAVYDLLGHELAVLVDGLQPAGRHTVRFDANDLPNGPYAYRLQAGTKVLTRTMMLVK